jgi:hypothetical protein
MITGKAELITHSGNRIILVVDMVSMDGPRRMGHLCCDTSKLDPIAILYPMQLACEDGTKLDIVVTNYSDRHMFFVGRIAA